MKRVEASVARQEFSDTLNHVAYGHKRVVVKRHGKDVAAIVPMSDLELIEECEEDEGKPASRPRVPGSRTAGSGQRRRSRPARRLRPAR